MGVKNGLLILLLQVLFFTAAAQICSGSLGDPIVNTTFGAGPNPGTALSSAATGYKFTTNDCPVDGEYTVRNSTSGCFNNTWHSVPSDHTGNSNGYFMVVNASYQPSAFYVDTVDIVCSNTTYSFSAWMVNLQKSVGCQPGVDPDLTFRIEGLNGAILQSYNTGIIPIQPNAVWKEYGFFFTAPPGISRIVLRIINNASGGCGNDIGLDDITFRPCGPLLTASLEGNTIIKNICAGEGGKVTLAGNLSADYKDAFVQWQESTDNGITWVDIPGANATALNKDIPAATPKGVFQYRLAVSKIENRTIAACRVVSNNITVQIQPLPTAIITNNSPVCPGSDAVLSLTGGVTYNWAGPNGFTAAGNKISIQPQTTATYYVQVLDAYGCSTKDSATILIHPKPQAVVGKDSAVICEGTSITLNSSGGDSYLWTPGSTLSSSSIANPVATPLQTTNYSVIVANAFNCTDTAFVYVDVRKKPTANAGPDKKVVLGSGVQLNGTAGGNNITYSWSPLQYINNAASLQPIVNPVNDITYVLEVTSNDNCGIVRDSVKVYVLKGIFVPNAFSPNNDGTNDTWAIAGLEAYSNYEVIVFNRYGQKVYTSKDVSKPWNGMFNGKRQPIGLYPYVITIGDVSEKRTGWVLIVK